MLSKLQNLKVKVVRTENTFRSTSFKHHIFKECLKRGEFTKEEFFQFVVELKNELGVQSAMDDDRLGKAWFAEFLTKEKAFEIVE